MNERIKELEKQSVFFDFENDHWDFDRVKFAELIVRECAKFLDENSGSDCTNNVWYPEPEELLKHFGVKE